jgi:hypothetical protein
MAFSLDLNLVIWLVSVAALAGQSWANTRALKLRQDDTNAHLMLLNNKTFTSHREIGSLVGAFNGLPCRSGFKPISCKTIEGSEERK